MTPAAKEPLSFPLKTANASLTRCGEASTAIRSKSVDEAWSAEIARRLDEMDSGKVRLLPGEEVRQRLRARLDH